MESAVGRPHKRQKCETDLVTEPTFNRHRAFLETSGKSGAAPAHRPRKIHRKSAKHILDNLDAEIRLMSNTPGLIYFLYDLEKPLWQAANWKFWPHMSVGGDLGPDNVAAQNAIEYFFY